MPKEKLQINEIISLLAIWESKISLSNAINFYDINIASEGICMQLLNLIYNYNLTDLNKSKVNFPAIDLGNFETPKIAFQVTSRSDISKIKYTLSQFFGNNLDKIFSDGVKIFILNTKKIRKKEILGFEKVFDVKKDIIYLSDLVVLIKEIYTTDYARFQKIKHFLKQEFGQEREHHIPNSILHFQSLIEQIDFYRSIQKQTIAELLKNFIHFSCTIDNEEISTERLTSFFLKQSGGIIHGHSGCGKSLLATKLSFDFIEDDGVILFLEAKYYESNLDGFIDREVQKHGFASGALFLQACKEGQKKTLIVIDGLNECPFPKHISLILELTEVIKQHKINFLITTQIFEERLQDLGGLLISVGLPEIGLKKLIAEKYCKSIFKLESIFSVAKTCLEAKFIGEIGTFNIEKISRFELFELYVRKKLTGIHTDAILLLSCVAKIMAFEVSFNLSLRQIDRILIEHNILSEIFDECINIGLLVKNLTKISFTHEMFYNFFIAESITTHLNDSKSIVLELSLPRNRENKLFILCSIVDPVIQDEVLYSIADTDLLLSLILGEGGEYCLKWANNILSQIITKIEHETMNLDFEIIDDESWPIQIKVNTLTDWTNQEMAFINVIPILLLKEKHLQEIFYIVKIADAISKETFQKLFEAAKEKKISLRSGIFSAIYTRIGAKTSRPALSSIFSSISSGFASFNNKEEINSETIIKLLSNKSLTNGQFYLLLLLCKYDSNAKLLFPYIADALKNKWKFIPYHLRNEILETVGQCYVSEDQRLSLIESLNSILDEIQPSFLSSQIFEALSSLGALNDETKAYEHTIRKQIENLLSDPDNQDYCNNASNIFYSQFDHPYDIAFYNVIDKLSTDENKLFYRMAIRGTYSTLFTNTLIFKATSALGKDICPYLLRFIEFPDLEEFMPQNGLEVFIITHIILGLFSYPIESRFKTEENELVKTLFACAEIYYWMNRNDLDFKSKKEHSEYPAKYLFNQLSKFTIECIWQSEFLLRGSIIDNRFPNESIVTIPQEFSNEIANSCRFAIANPHQQKEIFRFTLQDEIILHAIWLLERHGDISDLKIFRTLADHTRLGVSAIAAISKHSGLHILH